MGWKGRIGPLLLITAVALALLLGATAVAVVHYQQDAIESLLVAREQDAMLLDVIAGTVIQHERRILQLEEDNEKLKFQNDILVAASRMGWSQAYRFLREEGAYLGRFQSDVE